MAIGDAMHATLSCCGLVAILLLREVWYMLNTDEMQLYRHGALLGALSRYGYETPWASAWLAAADPATIPRYAAIFMFLDWVETIPDDLPDSEADAHYTQ